MTKTLEQRVEALEAAVEALLAGVSGALEALQGDDDPDGIRRFAADCWKRDAERREARR